MEKENKKNDDNLNSENNKINEDDNIEKVDNEKSKKITKRIILGILVILLVLLVIHTTRNIIIIKNLKSNLNNYKYSDNYIERVYLNPEYNVTRIEYYKKDNKSKFIYNNLTKIGEKRQYMAFFNGESYDEFVEADNQKSARLNVNDSLSNIQILDPLEFDNNFGMLLLFGIKVRITSDNIDNKDCYRIYENKDNILYIEKTTGLILREQKGGMINDNNEKIPMITEYSYEFDKVSDTDLEEPNISEYIVLNDEINNSDNN